MLRFNLPLLKRISYASLFQHNYVLQKVFETPAQRTALTVETPSLPTKTYTYGQLQQDVVALADTVVRRKQGLHGGNLDGWVQAPRDPTVRSVFSNEAGECKPSCDVLKDDGAYVTTILAGPGYNFVVALLASWSLNQLATPMSISQQYEGELTYVLEHSGARIILGDTQQLSAKIPDAYRPLTVRTLGELSNSIPEKSAKTFKVDTVLDVEALLASSSLQRRGLLRGTLDAAEVLPPKEATKTLRTAEDVEDRLEAERDTLEAEDAERRAKHIAKQFQENASRLDEAPDEPPLGFDAESAKDVLNPLFLQWYTDPSSRPTARDDCLMIYTSGTTARPKGAVHSHTSIQNQVTCLQDAWRWSSNDCILHLLPVHHVHGLVNVLLCSLASQAKCVFTPFDNPTRVARRIECGDISLVMAVPTIYTKLIAAINKDFSTVEKKGFKAACAEQVRLMVSGSAALPVPTLEQFRELSGHTLLERYGMTEIGMALSQPLYPIRSRQPGTVGSPLPTVEAFVQTAAAETGKAEEGRFDEVGALAIASASLFDRYWRNPEATKKELRTDATGRRFFDTGDTVGVRRGKADVYTILGRSSVDIIKHSGYKLSALEIEAALLSRKDLFYEMAVVGCKDDVYGESVVAVVALQPAAAKQRGLVFDVSRPCIELDSLTNEMKGIASGLLAPYKRPARYLFVPEIPRNPTGKVNKKNLKQLLGLE
eukprot:gene8300-5816_t